MRDSDKKPLFNDRTVPIYENLSQFKEYFNRDFEAFLSWCPDANEDDYLDECKKQYGIIRRYYLHEAFRRSVFGIKDKNYENVTALENTINDKINKNIFYSHLQEQGFIWLDGPFDLDEILHGSFGTMHKRRLEISFNAILDHINSLKSQRQGVQKKQEDKTVFGMNSGLTPFQIRHLHDSLYKNEFIDCSYDLFKGILRSKELRDFNKIEWKHQHDKKPDAGKAHKGSIKFFFEMLKEISPNGVKANSKTINTYFCGRNGEEIKISTRSIKGSSGDKNQWWYQEIETMFRNLPR